MYAAGWNMCPSTLEGLQKDIQERLMAVKHRQEHITDPYPAVGDQLSMLTERKPGSYTTAAVWGWQSKTSATGSRSEAPYQQRKHSQDTSGETA